MKHSIQDRISAKISDMPNGEVFTVSDFADIANAKTVSKTLDRICGFGRAAKIMRGIFWKPCEGKTPDAQKVANALARANNWLISPCGETALHCFGIADCRPSVWTFVTNGTYREYSLGDCKIAFRHSSGNLLSTLSEQSALLVQVVKAYGQNGIPAALIEKVSAFTESEKAKIMHETRGITSWVSRVIKNMLTK